MIAIARTNDELDQLAERARTDHDALNELLVDAVDRFRGLAFQEMKSQAEDVLQDIVLEISRSWLHLFDRSRGACWTTYLNTKVRFYFIDFARKKDNQPVCNYKFRNSDRSINCISFNQSTSGGMRAYSQIEPTDPREPTVVSDRRFYDLLKNINDKRLKIIFAMYYHDGATFAEIGDSLGISESRVSQMHSAEISRLQKFMVKQ